MVKTAGVGGQNWGHESVGASPLRTALVAAVIVIVQLVCFAGYFPLSGLLSPIPLLHIDHAYHWYQIHLAGQLWREGMLVGFDPTFAAGYLGGLPLNASARVPALISVALDDVLSPEVIYKLYVAAASVIGPALFVIAAYQCNGTVLQQSVAGALGIILWWASGFHWYHTAGMVSYVLAAFLSVPWSMAAATALSAKSVSAGRLLVVGLIGALGLLLHPHFPVVSLLMVLPLLLPVRGARQVSRIIGRGTVLIVVAALLNFPWLLPLIDAPPVDMARTPYQKAIDPMLIVQSTLGVWDGHAQGAKINLALMLASLSALWFSPSAATRRIVLVGLGAWLLLIVVGAVGAAVPVIASLQPNRWLVAAFLPLVVPAAFGISAMIDQVRMPTYRTRLAATMAVAAIAAPLAWSAAEFFREIAPGEHGRYGVSPPELRPIGDDTRWVIDWLKASTTRDARVMFETSLGRIHDGAHIAGFIAVESNRQFIGGPYPYMFQANAWDGVAFGKPLSDLAPEAFTRYLRDYNVGWIVAHSAALQSYLSGIRSVRETGRHNGLRVYQVDSPPGWFLEGRGQLRSSSVNHISISELDGPSAVLSYHYVPGLHATPDTVRLVPVRREGHTIPFLGIENAAMGGLEISYDP